MAPSAKRSRSIIIAMDAITTLDQLKVPAPAKINLFLSILGRREDGYHELQTLFQLLDFGDNIILKRSLDGEIQVNPAIEGVPPQQNLAFRAAKLLQKRSQTRFGAVIDIEKKLPIGGGLGGGSSDAASTLLGLNALWGTKLSLADLASIGLELGADVPVFIWGRSSLAEGIGERLYPVELVENYYLVLKPAVEVSTAKIFADPALTRNSPAIRIAAFFQQANIASEGGFTSDTGLQKKPENMAQNAQIEHWLLTLGNDCEEAVRAGYPEVNAAINWLNQHAKAKLTGTGSCIYAKFDHREEAERVLAESPLEGFVAKASNISLAHLHLGEQLLDKSII